MTETPTTEVSQDLIQKIAEHTLGLKRRDRRYTYWLLKANGHKVVWNGPIAQAMGLFRPNPRKGLVVIDPAKPYDFKTGVNVRVTMLGAFHDGTAAQRAQCVRGSCLQRK